jgi:hypothetical protein
MAGPIFRVSVCNKAHTAQRVDLLTAWADDKFPEQLRVSIAEETDADENHKFRMISIPDWIRSLASGERYYVNARFDKAQFLAWLQSAPVTSSNETQASADPF